MVRLGLGFLEGLLGRGFYRVRVRLRCFYATLSDVSSVAPASTLKLTLTLTLTLTL